MGGKVSSVEIINKKSTSWLDVWTSQPTHEIMFRTHCKSVKIDLNLKVYFDFRTFFL